MNDRDKIVRDFIRYCKRGCELGFGGGVATTAYQLGCMLEAALEGKIVVPDLGELPPNHRPSSIWIRP